MVDLLGMQFGKGVGHLLNQIFIVMTAGDSLSIVVMLTGLFSWVSVVWMRAIRTLGVRVELELAKVELE